MSPLALTSASRATDAGWLAAADIASVAARLGASYRLVGGLAVTLLVHHHGAEEFAPQRETADADMGVPFDVCGDDRLVPALRSAGYEQTEGNRFTRRDADRELVIDVLAPSYVGRMLSNQPHGDLVMDEVPGLHVALLEPATEVVIKARLTDGNEVGATLLLPDVAAALVMKAHAYQGRNAASDAVDIHRLLEAANLAGRTARDWPVKREARDAAQVLHRMFGSLRHNRHLGRTGPRVRLLLKRVVPDL